MKRALLATTLIAMAAPTGAQAIPQTAHSRACTDRHGARYCLVVEHRRAARVLLPHLRSQEARTHKPAMRVRITWRPYKAVRQVHVIRKRITWLRSLPSWHPTSVVGSICYFWHPCGFAIAVARCESGLSTGAANGQYLGLFQMGSYARSRYGHGADAFTQARDAHAYWLDSGWSPWECAHLV